jgi:hypothetical protein
MFKHIVLFSFKDENKKENLIQAKEMLEALMGRVPTLRSIEIGINLSTEERAMDMSLYSEFDDQEGLDLYATHPAHLDAVKFIKSVTTASKVSDYMV